MSEKFRLDRTAFKATTAKAANDHVTEWKDKSYAERVEAAYFLISHAFGIDMQTAKLDKTVFSKRKHCR